jgi:hypothetical protein
MEKLTLLQSTNSIVNIYIFVAVLLRYSTREFLLELETRSREGLGVCRSPHKLSSRDVFTHSWASSIKTDAAGIGISHLCPELEPFGTEPRPLIPVPDWFRPLHTFYSGIYNLYGIYKNCTKEEKSTPCIAYSVTLERDTPCKPKTRLLMMLNLSFDV